jgi:hypothetical protein
MKGGKKNDNNLGMNSVKPRRSKAKEKTKLGFSNLILKEIKGNAENELSATT